MKKLTLALVPVLCLAIVVFAFASCGKSGKTDATTAASTTAASTAAAETTAEGTTAHVHTPASEYTIDRQATCANAGQKSYHCTVCGEIIPESVLSIDKLDHKPEANITVIEKPTCIATGLQAYYCEECGELIESTTEIIPIDETAHKVDVWSDTPTLLNQSVHATGECTICHQPLEEDHVFVPNVVDSKDAPSTYTISKSSGEIRGDKHFHPTEEDLDGNDLWLEYSFLWNESFANWDGLSEMEVAGIWSSSDNYAKHKAFYYFYATDNPGKDCPFGGHFDYSAYMPGLSWKCAVDPGNGQPIYKAGWANPITEADSPAVGEYGWHRFGVHFHQEVEGYDEAKGGTVYAGYHELYVDGVKVWKILTNMQGNWNNDKWNDADKSLKGTDSLLWTATYDGENWTYSENDVSVKIYFSSSLRGSLNSVYVVIDDPIWTCGDGFVLNVVPDENPTETTITLAEGVEVPGTIHFKLAD